jgi:hypothetical protein
MKYRTFAFATAVAAASMGLLPATAMAASAHVATNPPSTSTSAGADAGSGSNSGATANNQNTINLKVVVPLPKGADWADRGGRNVLVSNNNGNVIPAPAGYDYTNGGLYSADGHFYIDPAGAHASVVGETQRCDPHAPGGIGGIIHEVLKACGIAYQWAYNTIESAAGAQPVRASYC